jgi:hypothetical protein
MFHGFKYAIALLVGCSFVLADNTTASAGSYGKGSRPSCNSRCKTPRKPCKPKRPCKPRRPGCYPHKPSCNKPCGSGSCNKPCSWHKPSWCHKPSSCHRPGRGCRPPSGGGSCSPSGGGYGGDDCEDDDDYCDDDYDY